MADLISRQAAIDALAEHEKSRGHNYTLFVDIVSECAEIIRNLPSAQPEIILCKNCIYYRQEIDMCDEPCSTAHNIVHEDDFCSRAERKEE